MKLIFNLQHYKLHPVARYKNEFKYAVIPGNKFTDIANANMPEEFKDCIAFVEIHNYTKYCNEERSIWQPYEVKKL